MDFIYGTSNPSAAQKAQVTQTMKEMGMTEEQVNNNAKRGAITFNDTPVTATTEGRTVCTRADCNEMETMLKV
tara:strand:+ start:143 stop:361 length:219 start_codon:yes stop_codon:yes gene_type:complete